MYDMMYMPPYGGGKSFTIRIKRKRINSAFAAFTLLYHITGGLHKSLTGNFYKRDDIPWFMLPGICTAI